jgi:hypothetical protein
VSNISHTLFSDVFFLAHGSNFAFIHYQQNMSSTNNNSTTVTTPTLDLESYASRYTGITRLQRLLLIAKSVPSDEISQQAFDLVEQQMRQDGNVLGYRHVFGNATETTSSTGETPEEQRPPPPPTDASMPAAIVAQEEMTQQQQPPPPPVWSDSYNHQFGPLFRTGPPIPRPLDVEWMQATEQANVTARQMLVGRLSSAQSHLHKEAIRTAYMALAEHDLKTGNVGEAMGGWMRATEYCTTFTQTAQLSLLTLQVAFGMGNFQYVGEYSKRLELTVGGGGRRTAAAVTGDTSDGRIVQEVKIKLEIAKGIERMVAGKYDSAAQILIPLLMKGNINNNDSNNSSGEGSGGGHLLDWPGVTSPEDLALYASLMCLVTQAKDRSKMIALPDHPEALELVPNMKDLLLQWSRAKYIQCMQAFSSGDGGSTDGNWFPELLPMGVDLYLTPPRFQKLAQQIREMCLVEYLKPYQCVKLESMQQLFPSLGSNLVDVLVDLMSRRLLPPTTRLDCRAGVLFQLPQNQNPTRQIQVMEEKMLDDAHALLVRLACLESDLVVQDPNAGPMTRQGRGRRGTGHGVIHGMVPGDSHDSSDEENDGDDAGGDTTMMDAEAMAAMNPEDMF